MLRTHRSLEAYCATMWWRCLVFSFLLIMEHRGVKLTGENRSTREKTCPSSSLSTTNPTWIDPGSNLGLRGERPATNRLSHGTTLVPVYQQAMCNIPKYMKLENKKITVDFVSVSLSYWRPTNEQLWCEDRAMAQPFFLDFLNLEDVADRLSQNVGTEPPFNVSQRRSRSGNLYGSFLSDNMARLRLWLDNPMKQLKKNHCPFHKLNLGGPTRSILT
jgi:hypothetical protein